MTPSDQALLERAVSGDRSALTELLRRHGPAARRHLQGKIAQRWRSMVSEDDVLQETYADAFLGITKLDPRKEHSFVAWLCRVALNNLQDAIKGLETEKRGGTLARIEPHSEDDSLSSLFNLLAASGTTPSQHAARHELTSVFKKAIGQLPETYCKVVRLYDLEGRSAQDVAKVLGCSPGAVFMRRARAHNMLQELLGTFSDYA